MAAEHLSLRVNPNGMLPMILASVAVHILPVGFAAFMGPLAGALIARFQNSISMPVVYCVAVFFADFASLTAQTPKRLAQHLQTVRSLHPRLLANPGCHPFRLPSCCRLHHSATPWNLQSRLASLCILHNEQMLQSDTN